MAKFSIDDLIAGNPKGLRLEILQTVMKLTDELQEKHDIAYIPKIEGCGVESGGPKLYVGIVFDITSSISKSKWIEWKKEVAG
ncbi:MAG: hypothetical protein ACYCTB_11025 [bacterium]